MHFLSISFITTTALFSIAGASYQGFDAGIQQIIKDGYETTRSTRTLTRTSMVTITRTVPQPEATVHQGTATVIETTFVTILPQSPKKPDMGDRIWYAGQRMHGCDKTACASCRWWLKCQGGEPECATCDAAEYCAACANPKSAAELISPAPGAGDRFDPDALPAGIDEVCSLDGQVIPCKPDDGSKVYIFGDKNPSSPIGREKCSLREGALNPCPLDAVIEDRPDFNHELV